MGSEFGQWGEWNDAHHWTGTFVNMLLISNYKLVKDLNHLHQNEASLYELDSIGKALSGSTSMMLTIV